MGPGRLVAVFLLRNVMISCINKPPNVTELRMVLPKHRVYFVDGYSAKLSHKG